MNLYYESLLQEIEDNLKAGNNKLALAQIEQELSMPYVPADAAARLIELKKDAISMAEPEPSHISDSRILKLANGNMQQKEAAVSLLRRTNLRMQQKAVEAILNSDADDIIKGQLIEHLMEQKVDDAYSMDKHGLQVDFIPSLILKADDDPGITETRKLLESWFLGEDIVLYNFCISLLDQEILASRPFDFSEEDPYALAKAIVTAVYKAFGLEDQTEDFIKEHDLQNVQAIPLAIEK